MKSKCVLKEAGQEANEAFGEEQMCRGVEEGIEGGIHMMRLLWEQNSQEDDWGFLLIDASKTFNEENWMAIMCPSCFKWSSEEKFT